ncbi:MAG: hypothetical protein ABH812_04060 [bacterium]
MVLKFIYTLFIGFLFATLVGVGISAFYESPKPPIYPTALSVPCKENIDNEEFNDLTIKQGKFDNEQKTFQEKEQIYNRNISIIAIIASILTLLISLTLFKKILVIADGLLLGGVLTILYGIIRGFGSGNDKFRFIIVLIGFIVSLILGYIKFIKPQTKK